MFPRLLIFAVVVLAGCQDIVDAPDLPYVERMVVYSIVTAGQEISVSFSRTLPLNKIYTLQEAALSDVAATVEADGRVYPLHYDSLGVYRTSGLIVKGGGVYGLHAVWRGTTCEAQTRVPDSLTIDSLLILNGAGPYGWSIVRAIFFPRPAETYALTWQISGQGVAQNQEFGFSTLVRQEDARNDGKVNLDEHIYILPGYGPTTLQHGSILAVIQAFDGPFYDYFKSRSRVASTDDIFAQPGGSVRWNVRGDAIGLFIGKSVTSVKLDF